MTVVPPLIRPLVDPLGRPLNGGGLPWEGGGGAAPPWTPASLGTAVVGWYDAGVGITLNGADVDSWADQSGHGHTLSAPAAGNRPLFEAAGLGTGPSMVFDGAGEYLRVAAFSFGAAVADYTFAFFGQGVSFTNLDMVSSYGMAGFRFRQAAVDKLSHVGPAGAALSTTTTAHTSARLWSCEWTGAEQRVYVNTTLEDFDANASAAPADGQEFAIGSLAGGALFCNVRIGGVVVCDRVLTAAERASLYAYGQRKGWVT